MPQTATERTIVVPSDVLFTEVDSDATPQGVLLNLVTRQYYSLNETGLFIWKRLAAGAPLAEVGAQLSAEFEVDAQTALRSVTNLIDELALAKLLVLEPATN